MLSPTVLLQPKGAISQDLRTWSVALSFQQECEVDQRLVVCGIEVERLAVTGRGVSRVTGRVAHQRQQMKRVR